MENKVHANGNGVSFDDLLESKLSELDAFTCHVTPHDPFHSDSYERGIGKHRKLLNLLPWFDKPMAIIRKTPKFIPETNTWDGSFMIIAYDKKPCEELITKISQLGIPCEMQMVSLSNH